MTQNISNKRGRKQKNLFGYVDEYVDTWTEENGEWVYIGQSKKRVARVEEKDGYRYYKSPAGYNLRQKV